MLRYNWEVATRVKAGQIYFASTPEVPVPPVLAPTPELVDLMAAMGLLQLLVRAHMKQTHVLPHEHSNTICLDLR